MPLLNRGIRLAAGDTQILLNNRVFENSSGTAFVTVKPDAPAATSSSPSSLTVALLDPGTIGANANGYLRVSIKHLDITGANNQFAFVIQPLGSTAQSPIETAPINYTDEATLGISWNASTGQISYTVASADKLSVATQSSSGTAFTAGVSTTSSGLASSTTLDVPLAINDSKYSGFLDKFASYSNVMTSAELERNALDPANQPTANRLLLLDGTTLAGTDRVDTSAAEVQQITFGSALNSGVITVGGARTVVMAGDSGSTIAEKVRASLADNALFKPQLEKQKITFSGTVVSGTLKVAGDSITLASGDTPSGVAAKVKAWLDGTAVSSTSTFVKSNSGRLVQDNGDGSLTITFNSADGDRPPIAVDSGATTIKASVDTVQTFNATTPGRKVSASGTTVSIVLNPADMNAQDLSVDVGGTGVNITDVRSGVSNHNREATSFVPSQFSFAGTPVGEIQRGIVTTGADADGGTFTLGGPIPSTQVVFAAKSGGYSVSETASKIADTLKTAITSGTITNLIDVKAVGDYVEAQFKASAGNVPISTFSDGSGEAATGIKGRSLTTQQYAQNLPGGMQTITFTGATAAGAISVDGLSVDVLANDSATAVANKVLSKLVGDRTGGVSTPEIQQIAFTGPASSTGTFSVNGVSVSVASGASAATIATSTANALNAVTGKNYTAVASSDNVIVTFETGAGNAPAMLVTNLVSGVTATVTESQAFNPNDKTLPDTGRYSVPEIQILTFLTGASSAGTINVDGQTVSVSSGATTSQIAADVARALNSVSSRSYNASIDGDSVLLTFFNSAGDAALRTGLSTNTIGVSATTVSTIQEYNANGKRITKVNADGTLSIEFPAYEGAVAPVLFTDGGSTGVTASVATTREANAVRVTSSSYTGNVTAPTDTTLPSSHVIYTQLVSTESGVAGKTTKKLIFDIFVDPVVVKNTKVGTGYETVDFTLGYSTNDFSPSSVNVVLAKSVGGSPIFNATKPGEVVVRWLDTGSATDFTKPIARVTVDQLPVSTIFRDNIDFTFSSINIDGVDYSDGTVFSKTYTDTLNTDRWDIKQKLVNGLDSTTPIAGQLVGYYGSTSATGRQFELKFKDMKDPGTAPGTMATTTTLTNTSKVVSMDVVNADVVGLKAVKFAIELPSNADISGTGATAGTSFTLSAAATAAGLKLSTATGAKNGVDGRTLFVTLDGSTAGLKRGETIVTVNTKLDNARDVTHEFSFVNGSINFTNATTTNASGTGKSLYVGYTATASDAIAKGEWTAKDMPRGDFTKFFVDTAPTNASKVITAADALQILKLSANFDLDWKTGTPPTGAYAAADLDGSGKVNSADALIALRYATGQVPTPDPVKWQFFDSATTGLGVENTKIQALRPGMPVSNNSEILEITAANSQKDFFTQAILVGNLTNPALEV